MNTTDTTTTRPPLAERITLQTVVAAENDPRFIYALNEDQTNVFDMSIRRGFRTQGSDKTKWEWTSDDELDANAELIIEAFDVTHETERTPRQLADERAELIVALKSYANPLASRDRVHKQILELLTRLKP